MELTGADASSQNGQGEKPNWLFGQMMRCMLRSAGIGPAYWSYTLIYAVYIKHRLPHRTITNTPFQVFTGIKPNLDRIRLIGCHSSVKQSGKRDAKLDNYSYTSKFLSFTATPKIINYIDDNLGKVKSGTHTIFDEAHMVTPATKAPLTAQALQRLGYHMYESSVKDKNNKHHTDNNDSILVQNISTTAKVPDRGSTKVAGYDLFFDKPSTTIQPNEI